MAVLVPLYRSEVWSQRRQSESRIQVTASEKAVKGEDSLHNDDIMEALNIF